MCFQEFSVQSYIYEIWKDDRLNLTYFEEHYTETPVLPSYIRSKIWEPDLVFDNTKDGKLFHLSIPNTVIKVMRSKFLKKATR